MNGPLGNEDRSYRAAFAWMQVRETDRKAHSFKLCRRIQLTQRLALDPAFA